jgi:hypothetical protein
MTLPFLERDLAESKRKKSEIRFVPRKPEELFAALTMLRDVFEEAAMYGATFDLQERYASLRRWMLRSPDEIVRLLLEQRVCALGTMIAVSRLEPTTPHDILALVTPRDLAESLRRHPLAWRRLLDEFFYEARVVRKSSRA